MGSKIIGFLGADKYDILLYLSRILCRLNQKVLLVDYSEDRALTYCIPIPGGCSGLVTFHESNAVCMQEEKSQIYYEKIAYQGVDFLIEPKYQDLLKMQGEYDIILVDFGFQVYSQLISQCSQIFLCMDQQLHHICQLKPLKVLEEGIEERCSLVFRQIYDCKISAAYLMEEINLTIKEDSIFEYYQETSDLKYCIDSQYNHTFQFAHISKGLKSCILFILRKILPSLSEQQRKRAYRCARAGSQTVRKR